MPAKSPSSTPTKTFLRVERPISSGYTVEHAPDKPAKVDPFQPRLWISGLDRGHGIPLLSSRQHLRGTPHERFCIYWGNMARRRKPAVGSSVFIVADSSYRNRGRDAIHFYCHWRTPSARGVMDGGDRNFGGSRCPPSVLAFLARNGCALVSLAAPLIIARSATRSCSEPKALCSAF